LWSLRAGSDRKGVPRHHTPPERDPAGDRGPGRPALRAQLLDEINALADVMGDDADFRRLVGDCYRQFGLLDQALLSYRRGCGFRRATRRCLWRSAPSPTFKRLQRGFAGVSDRARCRLRPIVANYDLSLTYAQTYHSRERRGHGGGAASRRKTPPDGRQGAGPRHHHAAFRRGAVAMLGRKDPLLLLNRGSSPRPSPASAP